MPNLLFIIDASALLKQYVQFNNVQYLFFVSMLNIHHHSYVRMRNVCFPGSFLCGCVDSIFVCNNLFIDVNSLIIDVGDTVNKPYIFKLPFPR